MTKAYVAVHPKAPPIHAAAPSRLLQRKCACEEKPDQDEQKGVLQRKADGTGLSAGAPPVVGQVLDSPGSPLDTSTRAFMEPRFAHDFGRVEVHTDARAGESARAVGAQAYTVGRHLVFGPGQYAPQTENGRRLIAHELAHVVQQGGLTPPVRHPPGATPAVQQGSLTPPAGRELSIGAPSTPAEAEADAAAAAVMQGASTEALSNAGTPFVQRACLSAADCARIPGSSTKFIESSTSDPAYVGRIKRREALCSKVPPDPGCTGDGHEAPAREYTALTKKYAADRLALITGIFVDKDLPAQYGADTGACSGATPPISGGQCTFVPQRLEDEASQYNNTQNPTIHGQPRDKWLSEALETITHETEHARVETRPDLAKPSPGACKYDDVKTDLSELSAILSEFHVVYTRALRLVEPARTAEIEKWFHWYLTNRGEDIPGNVKFVRCQCECSDADGYIRQTVASVTAGWNTYERFFLNARLKKEAALNWPVAPEAVDVNDLPSSGPTINVEELPNAK